MSKNLSQKTTRPKEMPVWMECTWRRKPCGLPTCPICSKIKKDDETCIAKGEDPNNIDIVLKNVGNNLREVMKMIQEDAKRHGIEITNTDTIKEPPLPEKFPLYNEVLVWQKNVFSLDNPRAGFWAYTEEAQDLFWYANTLGAKVYRQLCNRWEMENGADYGEFDFRYTNYVLFECLKTLRETLSKVIAIGSYDKGKLIFILAQVIQLERKILAI